MTRQRPRQTVSTKCPAKCLDKLSGKMSGKLSRGAPSLSNHNAFDARREFCRDISSATSEHFVATIVFVCRAHRFLRPTLSVPLFCRRDFVGQFFDFVGDAFLDFVGQFLDFVGQFLVLVGPRNAALGVGDACGLRHRDLRWSFLWGHFRRPLVLCRCSVAVAEAMIRQVALVMEVYQHTA